MKKIALCLLSIWVLSLSSVTFAVNPKKVEYKGFTYPVGKKIEKLGGYATDVIVINNTPETITISAPGVYKDYVAGNSVYRLTSNSRVSPEIILWHPAYGSFYDRFVEPHSVVSFSIQYSSSNVITVEYF